MTLLYKLIYNRHVNWSIRNLFRLIPNLNRKYKLPPSGVLTISMNGDRLKMATNQTCYVTHLLFWEGYRAFEYSDLFINLIGKVNTFYDVGANIGYYSLLGSKFNNNLKAYAFEPAKGPGHFLEKNINLNKKENVIQHFDLALSDQEGTINFHEVRNDKYTYLEYNLSGENNLVGKITNKSFTDRQVQTQTLDSLVSDLDLKVPDLIKIDTEGAEIQVLKGAQNVISKARPIVICEILDLEKAEGIENYFQELGEYSILKLIKSKSIRISEITSKDLDESHDYLFIPIEKLNLIE